MGAVSVLAPDPLPDYRAAEELSSRCYQPLIGQMRCVAFWDRVGERRETLAWGLFEERNLLDGNLLVNTERIDGKRCRMLALAVACHYASHGDSPGVVNTTTIDTR